MVPLSCTTFRKVFLTSISIRYALKSGIAWQTTAQFVSCLLQLMYASSHIAAVQQLSVPDHSCCGFDICQFISLNTEGPHHPTPVVQIETEEDTLWGPHFREEKDEIKARGQRFMQWLMTRPEPRIAVVSHSSFLFFTMSSFGHHASERVQVQAFW